MSLIFCPCGAVGIWRGWLDCPGCVVTREDRDADSCDGIERHADPAVAVLQGIDEDPLCPDYPGDLVDADLRAMGVDPEALAERGREFVEGLLRERRER